MLAGAPDNNNGYDKQHVDGVDVYVSEDIRPLNSGIEVVLGGWGPFRSLTVVGAMQPTNGC